MNPLSLRKDTVAACARYAAGLEKSVIGIGLKGYCTTSQSGKLETYMDLPMTNKCDMTEGNGAKNNYRVYTLENEKISTLFN